MSKRKKADPNPEEEEEDEEDNDSHDKQPPQKIYDFHKKTIEVYPERLLELNQQFLSSISSQIKAEPYSVLVGNCLDYVRQYFTYEDDLLKYSPWLATRLKQSRSDIVQCLQETIDVYEALARNDFDRILDKNQSETSETDETNTNKNDNSAQSTTSSIQFRPPATTTTTTTTTTSSSLSLFNFTKPTTTTASTDSTPPTGFSFKMPTTTTTTASTDSTPPPSFSFKMPTATTTTSPPEKTTNSSPFAFSIPNTGFGTSTFSSPIFGNSNNTEKSSISSASSISFATPPKFSFAPTSTDGGEQQGTTEDNEDEPSEPPEPEKVEHESDAKLTYRCRMGVNKGGKLIKRGPVQVIVKEANEKRQLIVRSDDTLGRLYLNILWSKLIEIKKNSSKDLTFVCKLNPGMTEVKEGEFVMILFRFDNETDRNDAYEKLDKERT